MQRRYCAELDVYSGIAIIFVVLLHSNAYYLSGILKLNSYIQGGIILNFIDKIVHISVPMFIFISGYKYMMNNHKETYREYFKKKMLSIFMPFFVISTFYLTYHWIDVFIKRFRYIGVWDIQYVAERFAIGFFKMFIGYNFAYQFWYIPMYLMICLTYPLFYRYIKSSKLRLGFFIGLAIAWEAADLLRIPYLSSNPYPFNFIYYFFIYEMGCLFYSGKLSSIRAGTIIFLYVSMLAVVCIINNPIYSRLLYALVFTPVSVIAYYYIALLIKENCILKFIGKCSFFIYLFHEPLVLSNFSRYLLRHGLYKSYFTTIFIAVVSIAASIIIYKLISMSFFKKAIFVKEQRSF